MWIFPYLWLDQLLVDTWTYLNLSPLYLVIMFPYLFLILTYFVKSKFTKAINISNLLLNWWILCLKMNIYRLLLMKRKRRRVIWKCIRWICNVVKGKKKSCLFISTALKQVIIKLTWTAKWQYISYYCNVITINLGKFFPMKLRDGQLAWFGKVKIVSCQRIWYD